MGSSLSGLGFNWYIEANRHLYDETANMFKKKKQNILVLGPGCNASSKYLYFMVVDAG